MSVKRNKLTNSEYYKLANYVGEFYTRFNNKSLDAVAAELTIELGFIVTAGNLKGVRNDLGLAWKATDSSADYAALSARVAHLEQIIKAQGMFFKETIQAEAQQ